MTEATAASPIDGGGVAQDGDWILQFCHGYYGPFADCARQYAALFAGTRWKVCTVYLTGQADAEVARISAADEVLFLEFSSAAVGGLKLAAIRALRSILRSRRFVLCIAHRQKPVTIALLASTLPVLGVYHALGNYRRRSHRLLARHFRARLWLLGVSDAVRDDLRTALPRWPQARIETFYNRIDVATVQAAQCPREQAREHLGLPARSWVIANVGRLHPDKDQATLIRGFARALPGLPEGSLLLIIGSGRLEGRLKALAQALGVAAQVIFRGQVEQARNYFKAFDLFVLSSDHESFGMVLLEAMAAGVPVLSTDCGGAAEIVDDPAQRFPLGDDARLAELLLSSAQRSPAQLAAGQAAGQERLQSLFSDAAARAHFCTLPALRELLPGYVESCDS